MCPPRKAPKWAVDLVDPEKWLKIVQNYANSFRPLRSTSAKSLG